MVHKPCFFPIISFPDPTVGSNTQKIICVKAKFPDNMVIEFDTVKISMATTDK